MKAVKFLSVIVALLFVCGTAQAQEASPQQFIGSCPDFPLSETLALVDIYGGIPNEDLGTLAQKVRAAEKEVDTFRDIISRLREELRFFLQEADAAMEAAGEKDADRLVRQQTGRSLEQVQNMSDAEAMKMANNMVSEKLGAMGLGNMSLGDLQALEGKSDEEIMQAMDSIAPAQIGTKQKQTGNPNAQAELKKINDRWAEIDQLNNRDIEASVTTFKKVNEAYWREVINEKWEILKPFHDGKIEQKLFDNGYEAALGSYRSSMYEYRLICYTNWERTVKVIKERIKTKLADAARYDELMVQNMSASGVTAVAKALQSVGYEIAGQYLDAAASITSPPYIELNIGGAIKDN
jgi:hypothetical protein